MYGVQEALQDLDEDLIDCESESGNSKLNSLILGYFSVYERWTYTLVITFTCMLQFTV